MFFIEVVVIAWPFQLFKIVCVYEPACRGFATVSTIWSCKGRDTIDHNVFRIIVVGKKSFI